MHFAATTRICRRVETLGSKGFAGRCFSSFGGRAPSAGRITNSKLHGAPCSKVEHQHIPHKDSDWACSMALLLNGPRNCSAA